MLSAQPSKEPTTQQVCKAESTSSSWFARATASDCEICVTALQKATVLRAMWRFSSLREADRDVGDALRSVFDPDLCLPVSAVVLYVAAVAHGVKGKPKAALEWYDNQSRQFPIDDFKCGL
jgi:hypothetical protein